VTSGGFVAVWKAGSAGSNTIATRGRLFQANGTAAGPAFAISTADGNHNRPSVIPMSDGGFLAAWSRFPGQVYVRKFDATGIARSLATIVYDANSEAEVPRAVLATGVANPERAVIFVSDDHDMHDPAVFVAAALVDRSGKLSQETRVDQEIRQIPGYQLGVELIARQAAERGEQLLRSMPSTTHDRFCQSTGVRAAVIEANRMKNVTREPRMRALFTNVCSTMLGECGAIQFIESQHRACAASRDADEQIYRRY
jgi:hypothetical protein